MLKGKTALVTGSTSGIGLATAHKLGEQGCNMIFNGFGDKAEIEKLLADFQSQYAVKATYSSADMSKPDQIRDMIKTADSLGGVDILVNNAGIQFTAPVDEFPEDKWNAIIAINLSASFHTIKAALPGMKQRGFGRIINIASVHGLVASRNKVAYVAAKHGIVGLTKVVALENAKSPITCNAICPGWVHTPLVQKQIEDKAKQENISIENATSEILGEKTPTMRFVKPEQIGGLIVFLCGDDATNMTGEILTIDGGWTAE